MSAEGQTSDPILPGSTIGILGGGQLGRMFAQVARRMGYRVNVLAPGKDNPAGQLANLAIDADYTVPLVTTFAKGVQVLTYEFENIPLEAVQAAGDRAPVRPGPEVLGNAQNRRLEKERFRGLGLPVTPSQDADSEAGCSAAVEALRAPCVIKSEGLGYDGKGQAVVEAVDEVPTAWRALGGGPCVVEKRIDLALEVSVVGVRSGDGEFRHYGVFENAHADHILDVTATDAPVPDALARQAIDAAAAVAEGLSIQGTFCVEFFVTEGGELLVNEMAPRPHNSGHLTIEASPCCQFEQQLRAICGLPLGATELHDPAAMANLLGGLWMSGTPRWERALQVPGVRLHLYGKKEPRPGRKMGHLTAVAPTREEAIERVCDARNRVAS